MYSQILRGKLASSGLVRMVLNPPRRIRDLRYQSASASTLRSRSAVSHTAVPAICVVLDTPTRASGQQIQSWVAWVEETRCYCQMPLLCCLPNQKRYCDSNVDQPQ